MIKHLINSLLSPEKPKLIALFSLLGFYQALKLLTSLYSFNKHFIMKKLFKPNPRVLKKIEWALITGATSGIGFKMADELAKINKGIICVGRNRKKLESLERYFKENGFNKIRTVLIDLGNISSIDYIHDKWMEIFSELPKIDLLINNAGVSPKEEIVNSDNDFYLTALNTNLMSPLIITNAHIKHANFKNEKGTKYVFISSGWGKIPAPFSGSYPFSKCFGNSYYTALNGLFESKGLKNKVSYVLVGNVHTPLNPRGGVLQALDDEEIHKNLKIEYISAGNCARSILYQSLNELETCGHPNHYLVMNFGLFLYRYMKPLASWILNRQRRRIVYMDNNKR